MRLAFCSISFFSISSSAEDGIDSERILFGQSAALTGPAQALGNGMRDGLLAAFQRVNQQGGVSGRKLELLSYDDGYEPNLAAANAEQLIVEDRVFALIGSVDTPTARSILPVIKPQQIPLIGPFTGAAFLRQPNHVINLRANYAQETERWIEYLVDQQGLSRIALFYQDDSFGQAGLKGITKALRKRQLRLVARDSYARNLTAVHAGLFKIRKAHPQAIAIVGSYRPAAEFIRLAHSMNVDTQFINISFVGTQALADELGDKRAGIMVTQVMPSPWDLSLPLVASYQRDLAASNSDAKPNYVSLEGYLAGRLAIAVLTELPVNITREAFIEHIYDTGEFEIDGLALSFGPSDNQGSDKVYLTRIQADGSIQAVEVK